MGTPVSAMTPEQHERYVAYHAAYRANRRESLKQGQRARRRREPDRHIQERYGLTQAQYDELLVRQGGACAICRKPPRAGEKLVVDHCHRSGKVRGLLHRPCNSAIGLLGDDIETVLYAADYLLRTDE